MKRMTSNEYNPCFNCNFYSSCSHIRENFPVCPERARYDRLAAIEDILGDEYDLDLVQKLIQAYREGRYIILKEPEQAGVSRLRELAQADREGRCVVLPCKVGDTLYDIYEAMGNGTGEIRELKVNDIRIHLDKRRKEWLIAGGYYFSLSDFGKTVFLTRAEAEAALRREQDG